MLYSIATDMKKPFIPRSLPDLLSNSLVNTIINVTVAGFLSIFVLANIRAWMSTRDLSYLLVAGNETLFVFLYLIRTQPRATSAAPADWGIGFAGSFIGTLLRPAARLAPGAGMTLVVLGTALNALSVLSLNRSIGTVAALREVKSGGMYAYVRHPVYASETCVIAGYLLGNASLLNLAVVVANIALLIARIKREELFLSRSESYRAYARAVKWRLFPYIY